MTSSNDFSHSTNYDPFATIEFTEEDLKKLRRPNPQPLDSDYFARENQIATSEWESKELGQGQNDDDYPNDSRENSEPSTRPWARNYRRHETDHLAEHTHQRWQEDTNENSDFHSNQAEESVSELDYVEEAQNHSTDYQEDSQSQLEEIQEDIDSQVENLDLGQVPSDLLDADLVVESEHESVEDNSAYHNFNDIEEDALDYEAFDASEAEVQEEGEIDQVAFTLPEVEAGENPFAYRSIEPKLRAEQKMNRTANVKPSFFQNLFQTLFVSRSERFEETDPEELMDDAFDHRLIESQEESAEYDGSDASNEMTADLAEDFSEEWLEDTEVEAETEFLTEESEKLEQADDVYAEIPDSNSKETIETISIEPQVVYHDSVNEVEESIISTPEANQLIDSQTEIEEEVTHTFEDAQEVDEDLAILEEDESEDLTFASDSANDSLEEVFDQEEIIDLDELELYEETYEDLTWDYPGTTQEAERALVQALAQGNYEEEDSVLDDSQMDLPSRQISAADRAKENLQSGLNKVKSAWERLADKAKTTFQKQESSQEEALDQEVQLSSESEDTSILPDSRGVDGETITLADRVSQQTAQYNEPILTDAIIEAAMAKGHLESNDEDATYIEIPEPEEKVSSRQFVSGAAWLSAGKIFSRVIGALYVIPWATWLGAEYTQANTLVSVGYKPYSLFLAIATAGFPSAVAKQMAYFNTKKEFKLADKLFKYSFLIMVLTGILSAAGMFFLAPVLAEQSATDNPEAAIIVIRSLAPALLILPVMSLFRGYFQGFNDMVPTAISEVLEQIARVIYMLVATYSIMMVYSGNVTDAVAHSTFAAFVGALASLLYLLVVYLRYLPMIHQLKRESANEMDINFWQSLRLMLLDSIPFILLGSGIILLQMIDVYTFKQILVRTSVLLSPEISVLFGAMSHDVDKLIMIIISIAVAIATSSIPAVTAKFAEGDRNKTGELVKDIVLTFAFVMIPASIGMATVSNNLYPFFYPTGYEMGPDLLVTGTFMSISLGAYTIFSAILQSMNYRREAVRYLIVGLVVKIILQFPMVGFFQAHGAMLATTLAFTVSSIMMWMKIWHAIKIHDRYFAGDLIRICLATIVMGITCSGWNNFLNLAFGPVGRGLTFVKIMLVAMVGIFIYLAIMGLFGMLNILIGNYRSDLQERMSIH